MGTVSSAHTQGEANPNTQGTVDQLFKELDFMYDLDKKTWDQESKQPLDAETREMKIEKWQHGIKDQTSTGMVYGRSKFPR